MLFAELAQASAAVTQTSSRLEKVRHIAAALRAAERDEVAVVVFYLAGELRQRRTGIGYAALRDLPAAAQTATLTVAEVDAAFDRIAAQTGAGSKARRRAGLHELTGRATADERRLLIGLVAGEVRQGALDGVMVDAVVRASELPATDIRRAVMVAGAIAPVAEAVFAVGAAGLDDFALRVGQPVRPMLAASAPDVAAALDRIPSAAIEWKLDGIRVQVHRNEDDVRVFTRTLDDVTARLPEVVEAARALPSRALVLDGEVIALDPSSRPRPFQVTASRVGSRTEVERLRASVPLTTFFFDVMHLDGVDLLGEPATKRWDELARVLPEQLRTPRIVTNDAEVAGQFLADAVTRGHEGVMVKALEAPYDAGRRGSAWIKVKPVHTLDLVVLAAEWGHGRRTGTLSNLHLGARDPDSGGWVMLGKTFKGMTDEMLRWQTEHLLALETERDSGAVYVRPELVVEVAFDGVQNSSRYPGGMALRFARVVRYRADKRPDEADTVETVRAIHAGAVTETPAESTTPRIGSGTGS